MSRPRLARSSAARRAEAGASGSGKTPAPKSGTSRITRGVPAGWAARVLQRIARLWHRLLERPHLWLVVFLVVGTWCLLPSGLFFAPRVIPGSIAQRDYVSPRDLLILDEESTREKERRAWEDVRPVYDFDSRAARNAQLAVGRLFAAGREGLEAVERLTRTAEANRLAAASGLRVDEKLVEVLAAEGFPVELEERLTALVGEALEPGVVDNKRLLLDNRLRGITRRDLATGQETLEFELYEYRSYPEGLEDFIGKEIRDWSGLTPRQREVLVEFATANLLPNLSPNQSETLTRRERAQSSVDRVFNQVRKGEVVVRKGDEVGLMAARVIEQIYGERSWRKLLSPVAGTLALLSLAFLALALGLKRERFAGISGPRLLTQALLLLLGSLLGAKAAVFTATSLAAAFDHPALSAVQPYLWAVPYASLALVATLLGGRALGLLLAVILALLLPRIAGDGALALVIYTLAGSLAAIFTVERFQLKQRLGLTRIGLMLALTNVSLILLFSTLNGWPERNPGLLGFELLCGAAGGVLASAVVSFLLPILEALFGTTTEIKLIELANTNLPVLRRLAFEAPGTFQHSLMVANLAKEGCEAIEADAVLAYTGGLYHDIGKVFRPEYFIENQRRGVNPHDKLAPSMSALVIINHVKEGVELAHRHHLPRVIVDAIEQHHGTRVLSFFFKRAQEQADPDTSGIRELDYRYPGPRPQDKVMGVLMLADAVEAAARTLTDPTAMKIRGLIRTIVDDCLKDGQLDQTDLTLADLRRVSEAFERVLINIYHQRVDYPGFDFNTQPGPRRATAAGAS
jgi:hypothetical protein